MDTITDTKSFGILYPFMQSTWRLANVSTLNEEDNSLLALQVLSVKFKFKSSIIADFGFEIKPLHELELILEEPADARMSIVVDALMKEAKPFDITIQNLGGSGEVLKTTTYNGCHGVEYVYKLNYAASETCKFPLKFTVEDVEYV